MKFGYSILYGSSVPETLDFYERAFGLERGMLIETGEYGELVTGDTKLAFSANHFAATLTPVSFEPASLDKPAPPIEWGLVKQDVTSAYIKAVNAGAIEVKMPEQKPWGQTVGYVRDLNGFLIEICSPIEG